MRVRSRSWDYVFKLAWFVCSALLFVSLCLFWICFIQLFAFREASNRLLHGCPSMPSGAVSASTTLYIHTYIYIYIHIQYIYCISPLRQPWATRNLLKRWVVFIGAWASARIQENARQAAIHNWFHRSHKHLLVYCTVVILTLVSWRSEASTSAYCSSLVVLWKPKLFLSGHRRQNIRQPTGFLHLAMS